MRNIRKFTGENKVDSQSNRLLSHIPKFILILPKKHVTCAQDRIMIMCAVTLIAHIVIIRSCAQVTCFLGKIRCIMGYAKVVYSHRLGVNSHITSLSVTFPQTLTWGQISLRFLLHWQHVGENTSDKMSFSVMKVVSNVGKQIISQSRHTTAPSSFTRSFLCLHKERQFTRNVGRSMYHHFCQSADNLGSPNVTKLNLKHAGKFCSCGNRARLHTEGN